MDKTDDDRKIELKTKLYDIKIEKMEIDIELTKHDVMTWQSFIEHPEDYFPEEERRKFSVAHAQKEIKELNDLIVSMAGIVKKLKDMRGEYISFCLCMDS